MTVDVLQQKKEELAVIYLADLKKELGTLQGDVVDVLSDRLKELMMSETALGSTIDDLDLTDKEKQLVTLSPTTAEKIFAFIKEKQEKLANATTVEELETLKTEMKSSDETGTTGRNLTASGILTSAGLTGLGASEVVKRAYTAEKISETLTVAKTRENMDGIVKMLNLKLEDTELLDIQKTNIEKSITYFEDARDNASCMDKLKIWKKLGNKLPLDVFNGLEISTDAATDLSAISKDDDLLKSLAKGEDAEEITKLLTNKGLKNVPEDVIKLIKASKNAEDIADITKVLAVAKPIKAMAKGLRMIPYLDIIGAGVDFRVFTQESGQADFIRKTNALRTENQQQRANFHMATGAASFAAGCAGVALGASAFGPPGWIVSVAVAAVGAITVAANSIADAYYYDVVDFYLRNKEDYKQLYRTEIKQAILQATVRGDKSFELSGTESFAEMFNRSDSIDENKSVTLEDAYRSIIYLEEIDDFPSVKKYNPEYPKTSTVTLTGDELTAYTKERAELDAMMTKRMEYIRKFLPSTTTSADSAKYDAFISGIQNATGISCIEKVIADSKTYQKMSVDKEITGYTDIDKYTQAIAEKLKATNETWFASLEKIYDTDPSQITEMYYDVLNYELAVKNIESYQEKYTALLPNITFVKEYYAYKNMGVSLEKQKSVGSISDISYVATEEFLENMDTGMELKPTVFTQEQLKSRVVGGLDLDRFEGSSAEYSSSVGQNVIYRIAKEIYGYTGKNDLMSMITYFTPDKKSSLGMYYDDGRYINISGRRNDRKITFLDIETLTVDQLIFVFTKNIDASGTVVHVDEAENITTATENSDERLNAEFHEKIKAILTEEKGYATEEVKAAIEGDIVSYIKRYGAAGYIKLPFSLINKAKRAGIGNVEYFYFMYKDAAITTCSSKAYVDEKLDFASVTVAKSYIENVRDTLSADEQKYITYVEEPYKRLMELRSVNGAMTHEDELDLPQEFESQIGDKYKEWERFKETLLSYDPAICKDELTKNYQTYHDYFENLYLAILNEISTHKMSNDIDGYAYLLSVVGKMQGGFFDLENKKLLEGVLSEDDAKIFYSAAASNKLGGKTITELAVSTDEEEQKKGLRGAKQILRSMLEAKTLTIDEQTGKITDIKSGTESHLLVIPAIRIRYQKLLTYNLDETKYIALPDFATSGITSKTAEELTVKTLTETETKTYTAAETTVKAIENTLPNVVRQDQRGDILYDDQKNTITSRGKSVEIDPAALKIKGLDTVFKNLQELLYVANLVNRFKYKYPGIKDFYFGSRLGLGAYYGIYRSESGVDTKIIDLDTIKEKMPSLLTTNNDIKEEFITYINSVT